jgi:hypothetical protein
LAPKHNLLKKLVTYVPVAHAEQVRNALFACRGRPYWQLQRSAVLMPKAQALLRAANTATPMLASPARHHEDEMRIETVYPANLESKILMALVLAHPYEEVAYDLYNLTNQHQEIGSGMIGELDAPMDELSF